MAFYSEINPIPISFGAFNSTPPLTSFIAIGQAIVPWQPFLNIAFDLKVPKEVADLQNFIY